MTEPKVAREVAEQEFERMCVARRIELDMTDLAADEVKRFDNVKRKLVKAIMAGALAIGQDGTPSFTARSGNQKTFTFKPATGAAIIAQDGKKEQARVFAALAEITGLNVGEFGKLDLADIEVTDAIYLLFFQHASSI